MTADSYFSEMHGKMREGEEYREGDVGWRDKGKGKEGRGEGRGEK